MVKNLTILGSTGSIGKQALDVSRLHSINIHAMAAKDDAKTLEIQAREFMPKKVALFSENEAEELKFRLRDTSIKVLSGIEGVCECAATEESTMVLNAIVGIAGLVPTLEAIDSGKDIALANKETLVSGGALVMDRIKAKGVKILPVDSEHSAVFQAIQGKTPDTRISKIILTASGGPFFGKSRNELENVTIEDALNHPNWSMGDKITIDSATMMNKGFEVIEAKWLFDIDISKIEVLIHSQSIIHSMVEFSDKSIIAQMGVPDMRVPIQYAMSFPDRYPTEVNSLKLEDVGYLSFSKPDYDTFDSIDICREAMSRSGLFPAAVNAANEAANALFRAGKIKFLQISELVAEAMENVENRDYFNLSDILNADRIAREFVTERSEN